ncbi:hypothetical protein YQE_00644, partial [Dendroctonus ponderosae]
MHFAYFPPSSYKQPTAFFVTAIHPVESLHIQLFLSAPLFLVPCHWRMFLNYFFKFFNLTLRFIILLPFYCVTFYAYYHGIIDHSGVTFKSYWWQPWQPDAIFHDNHHQYFHVNFAFNISYWDKAAWNLQKKRPDLQRRVVYNEELFEPENPSTQPVRMS